MLLTIDIGNTNLTLGLYKASTLSFHWRLATNHQSMPDEYGIQMLNLLRHAGLEPSGLQGICIASVVPPLTGRIQTACRQYLNQEPFLVSENIRTDIKILYDNPSAVGADRIVDAVAVYKIHGGPACIIDFGTATTFNALTADGCYLGGAIAPGLNIATKALFHNAAKLPLVDIERPPSIIGQNTVHAIQSGLFFGYVSLVEGMVARFRQELGSDMKVIATGGLSELIAPGANCIDIIDPWLTLNGIRIIWELNHSS